MLLIRVVLDSFAEFVSDIFVNQRTGRDVICWKSRRLSLRTPLALDWWTLTKCLYVKALGKPKESASKILGMFLGRIALSSLWLLRIGCNSSTWLVWRQGMPPLKLEVVFAQHQKRCKVQQSQPTSEESWPWITTRKQICPNEEETSLTKDDLLF